MCLHSIVIPGIIFPDIEDARRLPKQQRRESGTIKIRIKFSIIDHLGRYIYHTKMKNKKYYA